MFALSLILFYWYRFFMEAWENMGIAQHFVVVQVHELCKNKSLAQSFHFRRSLPPPLKLHLWSLLIIRIGDLYIGFNYICILRYLNICLILIKKYFYSNTSRKCIKFSNMIPNTLGIVNNNLRRDITYFSFFRVKQFYKFLRLTTSFCGQLNQYMGSHLDHCKSIQRSQNQRTCSLLI